MLTSKKTALGWHREAVNGKTGLDANLNQNPAEVSVPASRALRKKITRPRRSETTLRTARTSLRMDELARVAGVLSEVSE